MINETIKFKVNESQDRALAIAGAIESNIDSTDPEYLLDNEVLTEYEVTVTVREIGAVQQN